MVFFPLICPISFLNLYNILVCPVSYSKDFHSLPMPRVKILSPPEHSSVIWCSVFLCMFSEFTKASLTLHRFCQTHTAARERTWGFISIFAQTFWETVAVYSQDHTLLKLEISKGVERHSWYTALHKGLALGFLLGIKTSSEFIKASLKSQNLYLYLSLGSYEARRKFCLLYTNQRIFGCLIQPHVLIKPLRCVELGQGPYQPGTALACDLTERTEAALAYDLHALQNIALLSLLSSTPLPPCSSAISFYICFQRQRCVFQAYPGCSQTEAVQGKDWMQ